MKFIVFVSVVVSPSFLTCIVTVNPLFFSSIVKAQFSLGLLAHPALMNCTGNWQFSSVPQKLPLKYIKKKKKGGDLLHLPLKLRGGPHD